MSTARIPDGTPLSPVAPSLNDLLAAIQEAREVIRELHGATKDLRHELAAARHFKDTLEDEVVKHLIPIGQEAIDQLEAALQEQIRRRGEGLPLNVCCSACGQVLTLTSTPNQKHVCGACGHKFIVRTASKD